MSTTIIFFVVIYALLLLFLAIPILFLVPFFLFFGMVAYGSIMAKWILGFYCLMGVFFPVVLTISIAGAIRYLQKHDERQAIIALLISAPHLLLFVVPIIIFLFSRADRVAQLTPGKLFEAIDSSNPETIRRRNEAQKKAADDAKKAGLDSAVAEAEPGSIKHLIALLRRAAYRMNSEKYKEAIADYQTYFSLADQSPNPDGLPDRGIIMRYLADAYKHDGQTKKALEYCDQAATMPQPVSEFKKLLQLRSGIYDELGEQELSFADQHIYRDSRQILETYPFLKNARRAPKPHLPFRDIEPMF